MSIFKRKIKNTFDVARDMGVDEEYHYWTQTLDMNKIEYLKIEPMKEESSE